MRFAAAKYCESTRDLRRAYRILYVAKALVFVVFGEPTRQRKARRAN